MDRRVEAVLLDIDGTVCEYRRTASDLLTMAFEQVGVEPFFTAEEYARRYDEFARGSDDVVALRERCFATFARERGLDPDLGRDVARVYAAERDHSNVRFCRGAREAIETLHGEVLLAAVTNGEPSMQSTKLRTLGVTDRFETVVHGGYDTAPKPSPDPFLAALDALDVRPERAVHVGNSLGADVAGATEAGVSAVWFPDRTEKTTAPTPEPDFVVETMADLPGLVSESELSP